ncbi:SDR family oxidoreductase [Emcibacter sp. SYSU 3D8]|uniref:SDR family NAD(P)-dependent oxidoreductase n=1 Tax=Emcibacter sp. SYSU 3D8 TaxID=3133969 RepID=UPI0031FE49A6
MSNNGMGRRDLLKGAAIAAAATATLATGTARAATAGRFEGKTVLITGGTSGIGAATAKAFAAEGAKVVICGRRETLGKKTEAAIRAAGGNCTYIQADIREEPQVAGLVDATVKLHGGIDIVHNNAGIEGPFRSFTESPLDGTMGYHDTIRTNLDGVFYGIRHALRVMLPKKAGVIVNTASIAGSNSLAGNPTYAASKHGVIGLTRSAAKAHTKDGIRVVSVSPGAVDTPLLRRALGGNMPAGRIGKPEEIAALVLNLAAPESAYISGADFTIDGGATA